MGTSEDLDAYKTKYIATLGDRLAKLGFDQPIRALRRDSVFDSIQLPIQPSEKELAAAEAIFPKVREEALAIVAESKELDDGDVNTLLRLVGLARTIYVAREDSTEAQIQTFCELVSEVATILKSGGENYARVAQSVESQTKLVQCIGKPFVLKGFQLDGTEFDITSLQGKVVLVDFWATWCGPCIQESQNIHRAYEQYSAKGFEVVGISVDRDRAALEKYMEEAKYPWIVVWDPALNEAANKDVAVDETPQDVSMATLYGITSIPTLVLIEKDGRAVALNCRGEQLFEQLQKRLGDPIPVADTTNDSSETSAN